AKRTPSGTDLHLGRCARADERRACRQQDGGNGPGDGESDEIRRTGEVRGRQTQIMPAVCARTEGGVRLPAACTTSENTWLTGSSSRRGLVRTCISWPRGAQRRGSEAS